MPRDRRVTTMQQLVRATANDDAAKAAHVRTYSLKVQAIIAAVDAGNTKAAVARAAGTSAPRVHGIMREAELAG